MTDFTALALETWYRPDNPLYHNPEPAILGLVGEIGECIDQWKKHLYKPDRLATRDSLLDERGDIWWYYRIVCWLYGFELDDLLQSAGNIQTDNNQQLETLGIMLQHASEVFNCYLAGKPLRRHNLVMLLAGLLKSIELLDSDIQELTELNYQKLSAKGSNGWEKAR